MCKLELYTGLGQPKIPGNVHLFWAPSLNVLGALTALTRTVEEPPAGPRSGRAGSGRRLVGLDPGRARLLNGPEPGRASDDRPEQGSSENYLRIPKRKNTFFLYFAHFALSAPAASKVPLGARGKLGKAGAAIRRARRKQLPRYTQTECARRQDGT